MISLVTNPIDIKCMFILMYSCYILSYAVLYNRFETNQRGRHSHDRIGSWIYNYLCNQCLSPLMLWVRISIRARCTTLCDKVCQWLAAGRWISPGTPVSSTNKADRHDIIEILLKVALSTHQHNLKLVPWFCRMLPYSSFTFKAICRNSKWAGC